MCIYFALEITPWRLKWVWMCVLALIPIWKSIFWNDWKLSKSLAQKFMISFFWKKFMFHKIAHLKINIFNCLKNDIILLGQIRCLIRVFNLIWKEIFLKACLYTWAPRGGLAGPPLVLSETNFFWTFLGYN